MIFFLFFSSNKSVDLVHKTGLNNHFMNQNHTTQTLINEPKRGRGGCEVF